MKTGKLNKITDVNGIKVGHKTIDNGDIHTGVTVIIPSENNIFLNKYIASTYIINGFSKTSGLIQVDELGTLESIIGLTNTLNVGTVQQAIVKHMLKDNPDIGVDTGTINAIVGECNDGYLNDIRKCAITEEDVYEAIENATIDFDLGSVGAGRGMSCFEMKGGIGSASRIVELDGQEFTIGVLILSNFGLKKDFILDTLNFSDFNDSNLEKGSIIIILATDIPLSSRQLKRVCKRMSVSLVRLGSHLGNGSGDVVIGFSTANVIPHYKADDIITLKEIHEDKIDIVFRASIEACEAAIMSSLLNNETLVGRDGHTRLSLLVY
ncbi:MAG: P1 family peptidase [Clostridium sp.]|uniref:DmpA family aminopeptidase n=1 Tax=Clostridium sp. TaxID=1506 RepID=UPI0025C3AA63|nr:P1 family peptidase [Clostridium sp.]MCI6692264.1 P1 family peptidase [Clostridium sp.]MDY4251269.1 P1 family peptidase [Clostridium sp.]MDY6226130.1 P1 family peptidase [Clostridium sp.]